MPRIPGNGPSTYHNKTIGTPHSNPPTITSFQASSIDKPIDYGTSQPKPLTEFQQSTASAIQARPDLKMPRAFATTAPAA